MKCQPTGPLNARIMIIGEAPGSEEDEKGIPFVGNSGQELTRILNDAGIDRESCFLTNVARIRPPGNDIDKFFLDAKCTKPGPVILEGLAELAREIHSVRPNVIVPMGNVSIWALRNHRGISSWRGSVIPGVGQYQSNKIIPTYHPAGILRQWENRFITVHDLRKVKRESEFPEIRTPTYRFVLRPSFDDACGVLRTLLSAADRGRTRISIDLETRAQHIACIGLAWSARDAMCIPLMSVERPNGYWPMENEFTLVRLIQKLLTHPNVENVGQNFLYDLQYISRYWGYACRTYMDTMLAHHLCWPGMQKGLDYLSSMYCEFHRYWKDEGKTWDRNTPEEVLWNYNCIDAVATWEISHVLDGLIDRLKLRSQYNLQMEVFHTIFKTMLRGVAVDHELRNKLVMDLGAMIRERDQLVERVTGRSFLGDKGGLSSHKLKKYFYEDLGLPVQRNRKTGKPTTDQDALKILAKKEPIVKKLVWALIERGTLAQSHNVCRTPLGVDRRLRCSYNVSGTIEFRFSSSEDAFGSGTNLQNLTKGKKSEETGLQLPNMRKLVAADPGKEILDVDLERADLWIVVWEAGDEEFKQILRSGLDVHLYTAKDIFGLPYTVKDLEDDDIVAQLKKDFYWKRQAAKEFAHATNYCGKARTVSFLIGETIHRTEQLQKAYLGKHDGIPKWWKRLETQLYTDRTVTNIFGNRVVFLGRVEELLTEAVAWQPASTVALVTLRGMVNIDRHCPDVEICLNTHDSLTLQVPIHRTPAIYHEIKPHLEIPLPYPDPFHIPIGFEASRTSWGDVDARNVRW